MSQLNARCVRSLPGIVGSLLGLFAVSLAAAHEASINTSCEIRLLNPLRAPAIFSWFRASVDSLRENHEARTDHYATGTALTEFGLFYPTNSVQLRIEKSFAGNYLVSVDDSEHAFAALLRVPPLMVWKSFNETDVDVMEVPQVVPQWEPVNFKFGTIIESEGEMRKYISVEKVGRNEFVITLGLDVVCDQVRYYTRNPYRQYILFKGAGTYLCRVPVIVSLPLVN